MAKTARRLVASDVSSPILGYSEHHSHRSTARTYRSSADTNQPTQDVKQNSTTHHTSRKTSNLKNGGHFTKHKNQTIHLQRQPSPTPYVPPDHAFIVNATAAPPLEKIAAERERIRMEFYATYDVMTGVRIAATLGGFFGLMVFLVIYKSRGETHETLKALKDPKIAAVTAAVIQEEEDRELQEAMEATGMSIYPDEYTDQMLGYRRSRMMSLGNVSAPPILNRAYRFPSLGYNSLLGPNRRYSCSFGRHKSNSVESSRIFSAYPMGGSFGIDDYFIESDDGEEADDEFDQITNSADVEEKVNQYQLSVPTRGTESRRCSNITCCSSESSYLERRCSAITLGLTPLPPISSRNSSRCPSTSDVWEDFYQPPDIQIIQPTPKTSPCPSERSGPQQCDVSSEHRRRRKPPKKSISEQESFDLIAVYPDCGNGDSGRHYHQQQQHQQQTTLDELEEEEIAETAVLAQQINKLSRDNRCLDDSIVVTTQQLLSNSLVAKKLLLNRRAPLASLSSLKISSIDCQDSDVHSVGSDSVFAGHYADTDEDMEQFSTDSDEHIEAVRAMPSSSANPNRVLRAQKTNMKSKRKSTVCADIELKPRNFVIDILDPNAQLDTKQRLDLRIKSLSANDNSTILQPITLNTVKRPASFSGLTTTESFDRSNICAEQPNDSINNNNITNNNNNINNNNSSSCSKRNKRSNNNMNDQLVSQQPQGSGAIFTTSFTPFHNSQEEKSVYQQQSHISSNSSSNNECVITSKTSPIKTTCVISPQSTVLDNRQRQSISAIDSPSVILELPVIVQPQQTTITVEIDPPIDPSLPGTSRKWSKETLF